MGSNSPRPENSLPMRQVPCLPAPTKPCKAVRALARGETGELRVGYAPSPTTEILPRALAAFQKATPGVRVTLLDLASDDLESALLDGRVHVSVMVKPGSRPRPGFLFEEIVRYALRVAVARRTSLRPHDESAAAAPAGTSPLQLMPGRSTRNTTRCSKQSSQLSM